MYLVDLGCFRGDCIAPNTCACEVGWEGFHCDVCVPLPGCQNGFCNSTALECICNPGWSGAFCEIRKYPLFFYVKSILIFFSTFPAECNNCTNGNCITPNDCV